MTDTPQSYWLELAILSFVNNVWSGGLQKFAQDTDELATLEYSNYFIDVQPDDRDGYALISLSCDKYLTVLSLKTEDDGTHFYDIVSCNNEEEATNIIYEILDIWGQGFFKLLEDKQEK